MSEAKKRVVITITEEPGDAEHVALHIKFEPELGQLEGTVLLATAQTMVEAVLRLERGAA